MAKQKSIRRSMQGGLLCSPILVFVGSGEPKPPALSTSATSDVHLRFARQILLECNHVGCPDSPAKACATD